MGPRKAMHGLRKRSRDLKAGAGKVQRLACLYYLMGHQLIMLNVFLYNSTMRLVSGNPYLVSCTRYACLLISFFD